MHRVAEIKGRGVMPPSPRSHICRNSDCCLSPYRFTPNNEWGLMFNDVPSETIC